MASEKTVYCVTVTYIWKQIFLIRRFTLTTLLHWPKSIKSFFFFFLNMGIFYIWLNILALNNSLGSAKAGERCSKSNAWPTSAATLPNVSSPSCRSEMRLQWAQSKRKRRHVRLAASSLTLASSKERFRRITAICSTRWASMSLIPEFRGGWKRLCQRSSHDVPSAKRTEQGPFRADRWRWKHI